MASMASFYSNIVSLMNAQNMQLRAEITELHKLINPVAAAAVAPVETISSEAIDKKITAALENIKAETKALIKAERAAIESQVKDRLEIATHNLNSQIMTKVQLLIEELKDSSLKPEPAPPQQPEAAPVAELAADVLPPSIDIDALTKDLLTDPAVLSGIAEDSSEFAFNTKRKYMRRRQA